MKKKIHILRQGTNFTICGKNIIEYNVVLETDPDFKKMRLTRCKKCKKGGKK